MSSTQTFLQYEMDEDDEDELQIGKSGGPSNIDINILSQKHAKIDKSPSITPRMTPCADDSDFDDAMNINALPDEEEPNNGVIPFGIDAVTDPAKVTDCTHSRNLLNDAVEATAATSPVVYDGLNENEIGAFPFGNDKTGLAAPHVASDSDDAAAVALFISADIKSADGKNTDTVQLDCDGVRALLSKAGGQNIAALPTTIVIQRHERLKTRPVRDFDAFLADNKAMQQQSAQNQVKKAVNKAQSGRYNKRQRVNTAAVRPAPRVNNSFDNKRANDRKSLYANLRRFRRVKGQYSLGLLPFNFLIDSYTTKHSVNAGNYKQVIGKMAPYDKQIMRADYRPLAAPSPVKFKGAGITSMGMLRHNTWTKLRSIDTDDRHILSFVTPEDGELTAGYDHITYYPHAATAGVISMLTGYNIRPNQELIGVMSHKNKPIIIELLPPSYRWMDVEVQLQSQPGGRLPVRDVHDDVLQKQLMNGYNRKVMNTLYGSACVLREINGDFCTDIDLGGVCAALCIPPLSPDAFILDMSTSVVTDRLTQDTAVWSYSFDRKLRDGHFSQPVSMFPFDFYNKIDDLSKKLFITANDVMLDRYMDPNKGDCDKNVRRATFKNANKFFLIGLEPEDTVGFSHDIRLMMHSNKINTSAGILNITEASPSNAAFVIKSVLGYCSFHRVLDPDCGGIKCKGFAEKAQIHDRIIMDTYKNKSVDEKERLREIHSLKYCKRCGHTYTVKHDTCFPWRQRERDDRDGSQALLFSSGSPSHSSKINFCQNVIIGQMLGYAPYSISDRSIMNWRLDPSVQQVIGNFSLDDFFYLNLVELTEEKSDQVDEEKAFNVVVCTDKVAALLSKKYSFGASQLQTNEVRYTITATVPKDSQSKPPRGNNNNGGFSTITADF